MNTTPKIHTRSYPDLITALELIKPITWFPPMWAFLCGAVSTGMLTINNLGYLLLGIILAGPIVCGMSQAANDWCDRHVDAINEPERPIPSGRMPGKWGLWIALLMSAISLSVGYFLGPWGFYATIAAVACAWIYSAEPFRIKRSGIWGPCLVGFCYEGVPWFTGAAVISQGQPNDKSIILAILYALGAFGIMTLNDFKALEGDKETGIKSLPVMVGTNLAALIACIAMLAPQILVIICLFFWELTLYSFLVSLSLVLQIIAMKRLLKDPKKFAPWYNGTGVIVYVIGMMISAVGLGFSGVI